ncbi:hypothetical protein [Nocardia sp. SYP-A9097]|uniref:hypothetical protein n=1 Tax=Nocardia sp. SYP-A9097 TaxID=2663237 RepID=UPI00129B13F2|nr:hypothetical protein [Nocardia sp. SYP-A9097]
MASAVSGGGADQVPVHAGVVLRAGQRLVAVQELDGQISDPTPDELAVVVSAAPTSHLQLPPMVFRSRLYECARAVWVAAAAPGAVVTVFSSGVVAGTARADTFGDARMVLITPLPKHGATIQATQSAPSGFPLLTDVPAITADSVRPLPAGELPPPVVGAPLPIGCENAVLIGGVIDGAQVTVTRQSDATSSSATFDSEQLWFVLPKPFASQGDHIEVTQQMPQCRARDVTPSKPAAADIAPAAPPPPISLAPPCAGSALLHAESLRGGAALTVTITEPSRTTTLQYEVPPGRSSWDIPVPRLPADAAVEVTEAVCTFETSTTVYVIDDQPPLPPDLAVPLFSCGRAVSVKTRAGAFVEIWADSGSGPAQISARVRADRDLTTVSVFPYLTAKQTVWALQLSCGGLQQDSPAYLTHPHPPLDTVELQGPLIAGMGSVTPVNAVSGSHVTVFTSPDGRGGVELLGERDTTASDPQIRLGRRLTTSDVVWAVQQMCTESTADRERHTYSVLPGEMRFTLPAPRRQLSGRSDTGAFVVHSADFACRFADGAWILYTYVENTETGYDCATVVAVTLNLPTPLKFGATIDIDLAAADDGLPIGLASLGYPSSVVCTRRETSALLQDPDTWAAVVAATAQWITHFVTWRNYEPPPEKPDWFDEHNAPPDPNQLFPPLPTETDDAPDYYVKKK